MTDLTSELLEFIRADLLADAMKEKEVVIDADTYLFDDGLVDSLGILRLIAFLELCIGRTIRDEEVVMEHFRSVHAMTRRFDVGRR